MAEASVFATRCSVIFVKNYLFRKQSASLRVSTMQNDELFCMYFIVVHTIFIFDLKKKIRQPKIFFNCLCPEGFCVHAAVSYMTDKMHAKKVLLTHCIFVQFLNLSVN